MSTPPELAVKYALQQVGKGYKWAGTGPNVFDCSGLTMMAWKQANVTLPHNSLQQADVTHRIYPNHLTLELGDLLFYYLPISHCAIVVDFDKDSGVPIVVQATAPGIGVEKVSSQKYADPIMRGRPDYPGWNK